MSPVLMGGNGLLGVKMIFKIFNIVLLDGSTNYIYGIAVKLHHSPKNNFS